MPQHNVLVSYWYYKNTDFDKEIPRRLAEPFPAVFADSGAFSAMTQGAVIDLKDYAAWVKRWRHWFTSYANLDVIGNALKTWENQQRLEDLGIAPLPCFHVLEGFEWLERYVERYSYIALGVAGKQRQTGALMRWLTKCFRIADKRVRLHGFGLMDWSHLTKLPWESVDSTTWMMGHRYGSQLIFAQNRLFQTRNHLLPKYARDIVKLGFTLRDAQEAVCGDASKSTAIAIESIKAAEIYLRRRHSSMLKMYLAGVL